MSQTGVNIEDLQWAGINPDGTDYTGTVRIEIEGRFTTMRRHPETGPWNPWVWWATMTPSCRTSTGPSCSTPSATQYGASLETAGSLNNGKQAFVTMELPEHIRVGGVD